MTAALATTELCRTGSSSSGAACLLRWAAEQSTTAPISPIPTSPTPIPSTLATFGPSSRGGVSPGAFYSRAVPRWLRHGYWQGKACPWRDLFFLPPSSFSDLHCKALPLAFLALLNTPFFVSPPFYSFTECGRAPSWLCLWLSGGTSSCWRCQQRTTRPTSGGDS